jgi:hypothetical protein
LHKGNIYLKTAITPVRYFITGIGLAAALMAAGMIAQKMYG